MRKINKRTSCVKNLRRNNKRTTGAEDTQNQHYQRVLTVVDSFVDVNPARTRHDLVTGSVNHLPDTKFTNDRNFLSSCLFDKFVVEQLATRIVNVIPPALIEW